MRFIILILISASNLSAQFFTSWDWETQPCPYDSSENITIPINFEIYQTTDGTRLGDRLEQCIGIENNGLINIEGLDLRVPLFISYKPQSDTFFMEPDVLYLMNYLAFQDGILNQSQCLDCTKLHMKITNKVTGNEQPYNFETTFYWEEDNDYGFGGVCFPTQKRENQYFKDLYYELHFDLDNIEDEIWYPFLTIEESFEYQSISTNSILFNLVPNADNQYTTDLWSLTDWPTTFLLHNLPGPQSADNHSYVDIDPSVPLENRSIFNIRLEPYESLYFQDFTSLRGGLVNANDTVRHTLNLEVFTSVCMFFVELTTGNNDKLEFMQGSSLNMYGETACLMMKDESTLSIGANTFLHVGDKSRGMVALYDKAKVELQEDSHLYFDGRFVLSGVIEDTARIHLARGAQLTFTEHAIIDNTRNTNKKLYVHLNKGKVDLSNISAEEREKIVIIDTPDHAAEFILMGNVANHSLTLNSPDETEIIIHDAMGQLVNRVNVEKGDNEIDLYSLSSGVYFIKVVKDEQVPTMKFIKI